MTRRFAADRDRVTLSIHPQSNLPMRSPDGEGRP
jgi:hypothetical protein